MGMFDDITCKYPLPVDGANDRMYQTKDTPAQFLDKYDIREDGTLWHEEYDIEDHSDKTKEGLEGLLGCMTRVNKKWVQLKGFTGEIRFYNFVSEKPTMSGWIEWSAYFVNGTVKHIELIKNRNE